MPQHAFMRLLIVLVAILAALPSHGQVYKWVDARGVTNYSSEPPADPKAAKTLKLVESRISTYTPDQSLIQAIEAERHGKMYEAPGNRIAALEGQRPCVDTGASPSSQPACQQFLDGYGGYYPYGPVVFHRFLRPVNLVQAHLIPGTIAGNVVGMNGYIPGNSAFASAATPSFARPSRPVFPSRGLASR